VGKRGNITLSSIISLKIKYKMLCKIDGLLELPKQREGETD
jgi:hypothetical protein